MLESIEKLREIADELDNAAAKMSEHGFSPVAIKAILQCDAIEREIAESYMLLPVDRKGEAWRIGDKFPFADEGGKKHVCTVSGIGNGEVFFYYDQHADSAKHRHIKASGIVHDKPRTLTDVLADLFDRKMTITDAEHEIGELLGGDAE